jgi:phospholipid transport system substrate-binding protein
VGLAATSATALAAPMPPDQLVKETTTKVLKELTDHRDELKNDSQKLYQMVDQVVLPHFDFERMSRYVLGRYWRQATPEQQKQFVEQFRTLLVRTYATALFQYTGQKISYKPFHHDESSKRAVVQTQVERSDGPPIPIDYSLSLASDEWKVYDIKIDNLSLVTNYRSQYGEIVQTQGMDKLISELSRKNKELMKQ